MDADGRGTPSAVTAWSPLEETLEAIAERLTRVTVEVRGQRFGHGSGVIWRSNGVIVTNAHVVRGPVMVGLSDRRAFSARVLAWDARRDLAALRIAADELPSAEIGGAEGLGPGSLVLAVGNPLGFKGALTLGLIHGIGLPDGIGSPAASGPPGSSVTGPWISAHLRLAPGSSGGPLADARGRVIGINTMIAGGLAIAIPSAEVERFLGGAWR